MKKINLRELYPDVYTTDFFVDVTEEVMETIRAAERAEAAYERKMYRYKAQYSLDCENGIENAVLLKPCRMNSGRRLRRSWLHLLGVYSTCLYSIGSSAACQQSASRLKCENCETQRKR